MDANEIRDKLLGTNVLKGTVFGEKKYGTPDEVQLPNERNLADQPAFDRQPYVNSMMDSIYGSLGLQQAKAGAQASKMGTGRSSGTAGQMANLAANAERSVNDVKYKSAFDTFKEQLAQKQFEEQMDMARYKDAEAKRQYQGTLNAQEDAKRRSKLPFNIGEFLA